MSAAEDRFWSELPLGPGVVGLARDRNGVVALAKPDGVLSHPNQTGDEARSLLRTGYADVEECYIWVAPGGVERRLWLVNRLDRATSGVILAATDGELAQAMRLQFRDKQIRKVYTALVFGAPKHPCETWKDHLKIEKTGGRIRTAAGTGHIPAESLMTLVRSGGSQRRLSLLRLEPRTGRSHQLRVQCARRGLPIVGDTTYGDFKANRDFARLNGVRRMFLHSLETSFSYEFAGRRNEFAARAPLPPEFETI